MMTNNLWRFSDSWRFLILQGISYIGYRLLPGLSALDGPYTKELKQTALLLLLLLLYILMIAKGRRIEATYIDDYNSTNMRIRTRESDKI